MNAGVVETVGLGDAAHVPWHGEIARRTGHPVLWQSVQPRWTEPTRHEEQLAALAAEFGKGHRTFALANTIPLVRYFTLDNTQVFDELPTWKNLTFLPPEIRKAALLDPETRAKMRAEWNEPRTISFHRRWDLLTIYKVARPENQPFVGRSVADLAVARGQDPLDAFLDVSLEEGLQTTFRTSNTRDDSEAMGAILRSPYILAGTSDAGAHVQYGVDFGYSTTLLSLWVRERGVISLEQAIHKLTFQVASIYGLRDRGLLRPGYAADVAIFDPTTVRACEPEWAQDYPANTRRLVQRSEGVHYTIVNGHVINEAGHLTGDLPGQVLRGAAYARQPVAV
jgi:N-acyl-D-aspartate/D-glutamate deacylase